MQICPGWRLKLGGEGGPGWPSRPRLPGASQARGHELVDSGESAPREALSSAARTGPPNRASLPLCSGPERHLSRNVFKRIALGNLKAPIKKKTCSQASLSRKCGAFQSRTLQRGNPQSKLGSDLPKCTLAPTNYISNSSQSFLLFLDLSTTPPVFKKRCTFCLLSVSLFPTPHKPLAHLFWFLHFPRVLTPDHSTEGYPPTRPFVAAWPHGPSVCLGPKKKTNRTSVF